jgi:hypothetical protein
MAAASGHPEAIRETVPPTTQTSGSGIYPYSYHLLSDRQLAGLRE